MQDRLDDAMTMLGRRVTSWLSAEGRDTNMKSHQVVRTLSLLETGTQDKV